ncbi:glycoside hydrolase family 2 protein [Teredinibacter purpureus]|uniref:glycoside hydrolase family 2 protein n=1 Tax=Teredinibacter purpureus TaxID=2731756 RepID=UPI0009E50AB9|nr:glycoside hydrolase family 2 TIM barrel-domain containing protein [Teredinibacter purpureus]
MKINLPTWLLVSFFVAVVSGCDTDDKAVALVAENSDSAIHTSIASDKFTAPVNINSGWFYFKSDNVLTLAQAQALAQWQPVSLPHTANIEPRVVNDQWQGDAWYQKTLVKSAQWDGKKVFIDFEAAMNATEIWLNGEKIAEHLGGYLPFSVAVGEHLKKGNNVLTVRLDNRDNAITGPKPLDVLDFNMYGGLYRNVWLRIENPVHITDAVNAGVVASGGIFVRYPKVSETDAEISVQTHLAKDAASRNIRVQQRLTFNGKEVAKVVSDVVPSVAAETSVTQTLKVTAPNLWSPKFPHLYQLETRVLVDGEVFDIDVTRLGIREFKLVDNQLYINGEKTFLRGVNRHQEYPYVGYALSDAAQYRDAEKIKAAGFDYVRLSHYPHSKAFMKAADELGLVLLDAILGWQYVNKDPAFADHIEQTCRDLIRRDRNHASVLGWECSLNESDMGEALVDRLHGVVHEEFPGENVYSAGWVPYGYDLYLQARQHRIGHYKAPTKPYVVSEYGDWEYYAMNAGLNQDSWGGLLQEERSSRQLLSAGEKRLQQQAANIQEAHNDNFNTPAFADGYWVMFDYNRGYADDIESSGIMSLDRLAKWSYYFYQSQRAPATNGGPLTNDYMVHIASYWQADSSLEFYVYSNAESVALTLNGKPVADGIRDNTRYPHLKNAPFLFKIPQFEAGVLDATAMASGKVVARHRIATPSEATRLVVSLDRSSVAPQSGVNDLVFVRARLETAKGFNSRSNTTAVTFTVDGDAQLVSPVSVNSEDGVASALVRLGRDIDSVVVKAVTDAGLAGSLSLKK